MDGYEYRVVWRREDDVRRTRTFETVGGAQRRIGALTAGNEEELGLSRLLAVRLERRPVGEWERVAR